LGWGYRLGHQKFYGGEIEKIMQELGWEIPLQSINIKYLPSDEELKNCERSRGKLMEIRVERKNII